MTGVSKNVTMNWKKLSRSGDKSQRNLGRGIGAGSVAVEYELDWEWNE